MTQLDSREPLVTNEAAPSPRRRDPTTQLVAGSVLIVIGVMWLLERLGAIELSVTAVLALATLVVGVSLMVLSRRAAHTGLIVFGAILAVITLVTAAAPLEGFQGGIGERVIQVDSVDDIKADYNLAMGSLTIDLRDLNDLDGIAKLTASVGMGELVVRVPPNIAFEIRAQSGAGDVNILGREASGVGVDETYTSPGTGGQSQRLVLDLAVFLGTVEVTNG